MKKNNDDKKKHILVTAGMRPVHKILKRNNAKISVIMPIDKIKKKDYLLYDRLYAVPVDASIEEWVKLSETINSLDPITSVAGFHEMYQEHSSIIAQKLNKKHLDLDVIKNTRDKVKTRSILKNMNLDNTDSIIVNNYSDLQHFTEKNGFPIILKPLSGWGSLNVIKVGSKDEQNLEKIYNEWIKDTPEEQLLVEEFIEGDEFSIETFSEDSKHEVISITKKFKNNLTFVEEGHVVNSNSTKNCDKEIISYIKKVLSALSITDGPSHIEIINSTKGPQVIEAHTRLAGDFIPELVEHTMNIDLMELWAKQSLGESVINDIKYPDIEKSAAVFYKNPTTLGVIDSIDGEKNLEESNGVFHSQIILDSGDQWTGAESSFSRGAFVLASGDNENSAILNAKTALSKLTFNISSKGSKCDESKQSPE